MRLQLLILFLSAWLPFGALSAENNNADVSSNNDTDTCYNFNFNIDNLPKLESFPTPDIPDWRCIFRQSEDGGLQSFTCIIGYPKEALERGLQGKVILEIEVNKDGKCEYISVISSTNKKLTDIIVKLFNDAKWQPAMHNGHSICLRFRIPLSFKIFS